MARVPAREVRVSNLHPWRRFKFLGLASVLVVIGALVPVTTAHGQGVGAASRVARAVPILFDGRAVNADGASRDRFVSGGNADQTADGTRLVYVDSLAGGRPGGVGENWLWPGGDESARVALPDKVTVRLAAGDGVQLLTPGGGGGWGVP